MTIVEKCLFLLIMVAAPAILAGLLTFMVSGDWKGAVLVGAIWVATCLRMGLSKPAEQRYDSGRG